jgi:hypothetical protein
LVLNLNKTHLAKFALSKSPTYSLYVSHNNQALTVTESIKFLRTHLDCYLTWNLHLDNLIKKLSYICFMLRKLLSIVNVKTLRIVYFAHFHSQVSYGIILWGSSSSMRHLFIIQKRAIRIMLRLGPRSPCRESFKKLYILTVPCLYIYALMLFVVKNPNIYQINTSVHSRSTTQRNKLHVPSARFSSIQRGIYYSSVKI